MKKMKENRINQLNFIFILDGLANIAICINRNWYDPIFINRVPMVLIFYQKKLPQNKPF